jgi:peptidoglycan/LPS O-acetylase OafA/YrhL
MKLSYRSEIDGLRAVAIIFIILSHFKQLNFVSGGVNIFFVISGYLITHVLINEKINIFKFYKNRFFKLYPNIFLISLITIVLFLFFGGFQQWSIIVSSFIATITGFLNFYLIKIGDVYGQENYINPFLPFWAFCVIIQFYFIYPIILKFIFFIKIKFNFKDNFVIYILILLSFILFSFYFLFKNNIFFSFYSPLSRYWQFILGSVLYFVILSKKKLYFKNLTIYFAVILIFIWQLNLELFDNWVKVQIILTIATSLFLYSFGTNFFNQILSIKPLTYLGKISYELYLIHMVVIYFVSLWFEQGVIILSLSLLFLITYFYNKFINHILYKKIIFISDNNPIFLYSLLFVIITTSFYFYDPNSFLKKETQSKNIFSKINFIEKININYEKKSKDRIYDVLKGKDGKPCYDRKVNEGLFQNCSFININNNKSFFLIGGSQVSTLGPDLKKRLKDYNYNHFTSTAHIYLPGFIRINKKKNYKKNFNFLERNNLIRNLLLSIEKKSIVLIGARYPLWLNNSFFDNQEGGIEGGEWNRELEHIDDLNKKWRDSLKNSIKELSTNKNIKIILLYPIPEVGFSINERLKNYKFFKINKTTTSFEVFKERTKSSFELLDSIKADNIYRVYPHTAFCNKTIKKRCITYDNKNMLYHDDDHPSLKGAIMINDLIVQEIEKIEF